MHALIRRYLKTHTERGQTLAEYALILGLIAIVSILAVTLLGSNVSSLMSNVGGSV